MRRITDSGSSVALLRISTSVAGRTPTTAQENLIAMPASGGLASSTVLGGVGHREDQVFIATARCPLETHSDLERLGKAAARLDPEKILVVVAESLLGLQAHFDAVLDPPALERRLRRRENIAVAAVQILHRLRGALERIAPEVGQLDLERDHRVFCDVQSAPMEPRAPARG